CDARGDAREAAGGEPPRAGVPRALSESTQAAGSRLAGAAPERVHPTHPRARIVCTLGPAVDRDAAVRELAEAGMDVARLNFSHGSHDEHRAQIDRVRAASQTLGRPIA